MDTPLPPLRATPPGDARRHPWHWYAARASVAVIVLALGGLLWVLHRQEIEEHRASLIRDVLWVEQNVQFSLEHDVDQLRELARDGHGDELPPAQLEARMAHLLTSSPGLVAVALLDADGEPVASAPPAGRRSGRAWLEADADPAYRLARSAGRAAYAAPHASGNDWEFEVFVPHQRRGAIAGTFVAVYGLRSMLADLIPWWLAEKDRVTFRDVAGRVLAAKSGVEAHGPADLTYQVALDPPGHGVVLHVESYGSPTKSVRNLLALTIVGLAAAVAWSTWSLRRHIQRRNAIEEALREEHAFRKAMEDSLETGMRAVDLEGRIIYVNPAFCRMTGFTERELLGHISPQPYWPPEVSERIETAQRLARLAGAPRIGVELELMRRGGERFDALLYETRLVDARGRHAGWMASVLDITERKRARERARQQEEKLAMTARLVTMGEMASAIAHELNQPLSAIASYSTGCLNLLDAGAASGDDLKEALRKTAQQAQRAGHIIRRVHEFVRKSEPTRSRVRIDAVVEEAIGFAQVDARKRGVRIRCTPCGDDAELDGDPVLLQQVVLNLLRNAIEAMAATPPGDREISVSAERAGASVTVRVVDRGCGVAPEVRDRLFDPFVTTKAEGMGMGLHICRSIMELHRGRVWTEPNPDGGAVFAFALPLESA